MKRPAIILFAALLFCCKANQSNPGPCPVEIVAITWEELAVNNRFHALLKNTGTLDVEKVSLIITYQVRYPGGDDWIKTAGEFSHEWKILAGETVTVNWILTSSETIRIVEDETYVKEVVFSNGTSWRARKV